MPLGRWWLRAWRDVHGENGEGALLLCCDHKNNIFTKLLSIMYKFVFFQEKNTNFVIFCEKNSKHHKHVALVALHARTVVRASFGQPALPRTVVRASFGQGGGARGTRSGIVRARGGGGG